MCIVCIIMYMSLKTRMMNMIDNTVMDLAYKHGFTKKNYRSHSLFLLIICFLVIFSNCTLEMQ